MPRSAEQRRKKKEKADQLEEQLVAEQSAAEQSLRLKKERFEALPEEVRRGEKGISEAQESLERLRIQLDKRRKEKTKELTRFSSSQTLIELSSLATSMEDSRFTNKHKFPQQRAIVIAARKFTETDFSRQLEGLGLLTPEITEQLSRLGRTVSELDHAYEAVSGAAGYVPYVFHKDPKIALRQEQAELLNAVYASIQAQIEAAKQEASEFGAEEIIRQEIEIRSLEGDLQRKRDELERLEGDEEFQEILSQEKAESVILVTAQTTELERGMRKLPPSLIDYARSVLESRRGGVAHKKFLAGGASIQNLQNVIELNASERLVRLQSKLGDLPITADGILVRQIVGNKLAGTAELFNGLKGREDIDSVKISEIEKQLRLAEIVESHSQNIGDLASGLGRLRTAINLLPKGGDLRSSAETSINLWKTKLQELLSIPPASSDIVAATETAINRLQGAINLSIRLARLQAGLAELPEAEKLQSSAAEVLAAATISLQKLDFNSGGFDVALAEMNSRLDRIDALEKSQEVKDLAVGLAKLRQTEHDLSGVSLLANLRESISGTLAAKTQYLQRLEDGENIALPGSDYVRTVTDAVAKLDRVVAIRELMAQFMTSSGDFVTHLQADDPREVAQVRLDDMERSLRGLQVVQSEEVEDFNQRISIIENKLKAVVALEKSKFTQDLAIELKKLKGAISGISGDVLLTQLRDSADSLFQENRKKLVSGDAAAIARIAEGDVARITKAIEILKKSKILHAKLDELRAGLSGLPEAEDLREAANERLNRVEVLLRGLNVAGDLTGLTDAETELNKIEKLEEFGPAATILAKQSSSLSLLRENLSSGTAKLKKGVDALLEECNVQLQGLKEDPVTVTSTTVETATKKATAAVEKLQSVMELYGEEKYLSVLPLFAMKDFLQAEHAGITSSIKRRDIARLREASVGVKDFLEFVDARLAGVEELFQRLDINDSGFGDVVSEIDKKLQDIKVLMESQPFQALAVGLNELKGVAADLLSDQLLDGLRSSANALYGVGKQKLDICNASNITTTISKQDVEQTNQAIANLNRAKSLYVEWRLVKNVLDQSPPEEGLLEAENARLGRVEELLRGLRISSVGASDFSREFAEIETNLKIIDELKNSPEAKNLAKELDKLQRAISQLPAGKEPRVSAEALLGEGRARLLSWKDGTVDKNTPFDVSKITAATGRLERFIGLQVDGTLVRLRGGLENLPAPTEPRLVNLRVFAEGTLDETVKSLRSLDVRDGENFDRSMEELKANLNKVDRLEEVGRPATELTQQLEVLLKLTAPGSLPAIVKHLEDSAKTLFEKHKAKLLSLEKGDSAAVDQSDIETATEAARRLQSVVDAKAAIESLGKLQRIVETLPQQMGLRTYVDSYLTRAETLLKELDLDDNLELDGFEERLSEIKAKLEIVAALENSEEVKRLAESLGSLRAAIDKLPRNTEPRNSAEELLGNGMAEFDKWKEGKGDAAATLAVVQKMVLATKNLQSVIDSRIYERLSILQEGSEVSASESIGWMPEAKDIGAMQEGVAETPSERKGIAGLPEEENLRVTAERSLDRARAAVSGLKFDSPDFAAVLSDADKTVQFVEAIESSQHAKDLAVELSKLRRTMEALPDTTVLTALRTSASRFLAAEKESLGSSSVAVRAISAADVTATTRAMVVLNRAEDLRVRLVELRKQQDTLPVAEGLHESAVLNLNAVETALHELNLNSSDADLFKIKDILDQVELLEGYGKKATDLANLAKQLDSLRSAMLLRLSQVAATLMSSAAARLEGWGAKLHGLITGDTTVDQDDIDEATEVVRKLNRLCDVYEEREKLRGSMASLPLEEGLQLHAEALLSDLIDPDGNERPIDMNKLFRDLDLGGSEFDKKLDRIKEQCTVVATLGSNDVKGFAVQLGKLRKYIHKFGMDSSAEALLFNMWSEKLSRIKEGLDRQLPDRIAAEVAAAVKRLEQANQVAKQLEGSDRKLGEIEKAIGEASQNINKAVEQLRGKKYAAEEFGKLGSIIPNLDEQIEHTLLPLQEALHARIEALTALQQELASLSDDELISKTMGMGLFTAPEHKAQFEAWNKAPDKTLAGLKVVVRQVITDELRVMNEQVARGEKIQLDMRAGVNPGLASAQRDHQELLHSEVKEKYKQVEDKLKVLGEHLKNLQKKAADYRKGAKYILACIFSVGIVAAVAVKKQSNIEAALKAADEKAKEASAVLGKLKPESKLTQVNLHAAEVAAKEVQELIAKTTKDFGGEVEQGGVPRRSRMS